jgi:hypothetical protein
VWAAWRALDFAALAAGASALRRAGLRELWLIGASADADADTLVTLRSRSIELRDLDLAVPR